MSNELELEDRATSRIVRFMRAAMRNPLSVSVLEQLEVIITYCRADTEIERLIFTGTDSVFASGADLREIAGLDIKTAPAFAERGQALMANIAALPQMTIAAINGYCFGGALDLALACDRRIASPDAKFAHPGAGLGIITGWGGTQRLPRLVGRAFAFEMFFTAEAIDAERGLAIGLVDEIVDDPVATAVGLSGAPLVV